jgi:hypothetical protein
MSFELKISPKKGNKKATQKELLENYNGGGRTILTYDISTLKQVKLFQF